jgi:membrane protein
MSRNSWKALPVFLFLIFVATTLLKVVKDSLNQLWNIHTIAHQGMKFNVLTRVKSFVVILIGGLLFLLVLFGEGTMDLLYRPLVRESLSFVLIAIWFSLIFKFLPDGKPSWKTVFVGGAFTSFFFNLGKGLLQWLLSYSSMKTIYGASTSSVLLLLFVFYSSFIFYYGACFTRVWAESNEKTIRPGEHGERYEWLRVKPSQRVP